LSFEHESEKKTRQGRGLGLDSGLDLAISRFTNSLGIIRGLGETDSRKKPEAKNLVTLSL
jgi:hypothetical protein